MKSEENDRLDNNQNDLIPYIVQYSDKSIAVFGNTKPIKDELKSLGGRFNKYLTQNSMKVPGWIFPTKDKDAIMSIISSPKKSNTAESEVISIISSASHNDPTATVLDDETQNPYIVQYSGKSIAVFGNTKPIKDELKSLGGRFNKYLNQNSMKVPGWIFPTKDKDAVMSIISSFKMESNELPLHPDKKRKHDD